MKCSLKICTFWNVYIKTLKHHPQPFTLKMGICLNDYLHWLKTPFWQQKHWLWNAQVTWPNNCRKLCGRGKNVLRIETFNFLKSWEVNGNSPTDEMPRLSMVTKKVAENSKLNIKALSLPINSLFLLRHSLGKTFIQLKAISIQYLMVESHIIMFVWNSIFSQLFFN